MGEDKPLAEPLKSAAEHALARAGQGDQPGYRVTSTALPHPPSHIHRLHRHTPLQQHRPLANQPPASIALAPAMQVQAQAQLEATLPMALAQEADFKRLGGARLHQQPWIEYLLSPVQKAGSESLRER
jgi:hypothetical protein